jgi:hypothetical protein
MPAKKQMLVADKLKIDIIVENEASVYFTDDEVRFDLEIQNQTDDRVIGELNWFLGRGNGTIDHTNNRHRSFGIDVPAGGTTRQEGLSTGLLTHQSNALIGVSQPNRIDSSRNGVTELSEPQTAAGDMYYQEGYSFTVWDREFYRLNYIYPRRAQYASVTLAVLIVLVGIIQILS